MIAGTSTSRRNTSTPTPPTTYSAPAGRSASSPPKASRYASAVRNIGEVVQRYGLPEQETKKLFINAKATNLTENHAETHLRQLCRRQPALPISTIDPR